MRKWECFCITCMCLKKPGADAKHEYCHCLYRGINGVGGK